MRIRRVMRDWMNRDRGSIAVLAIVVAAFFLPALLAPNALIWPHSGLGSDISYRHWPDLINYTAAWRAGQFPIWDSLVALGRPLAGDVAVLFSYPFDAVFLFLPPALAFNVFDALHVFLAGLFTYLFLRRGCRLSPPAALFGGLAYAFAPKLISHLAGGHVGLIAGMAWPPAVLLGLQLAFDGSFLAAALAGLALAMQMPTHLQVTYYAAAIGSAYWLWHFAPHGWRAARGDRSEWRSVRRLAAVYATWLIAFVLVAAAVLFPLVELLPYNSRVGFTPADANLYALPPALLFGLLVPPEFQFPEWTMYLGLLPLLLSLLGAAKSHRRERWFWALLAGFALIFALGSATPLFELAQSIIPGFNALRVPTRLWFFGGLAMSILAAFGVDALIDDGVRAALLAARRRLKFAAIVAFVAGGAALIGHWLIVHRLHALLLIELTVLAGLCWLVARRLSDRLSARALQWALVPLLLFDLLPVAASHIDLIDPQTAFLRSTPALNYVSAQPGVFRVYSPAGDLPYAVAAARGVESLEGLLAFQIGHAVQSIREATGCQTTNYATAIPPCLTDRTPTAIPDAERLGFLNVRYVISAQPLTAPGFVRVMDGSPSVYENALWQPRVRVTPAGRAGILDRLAGEYDIAVNADNDVQVVIVETWLPGWRATVDGREWPVERVEEALIGVKLPAGAHMLLLRYAPIGWQIGWPVSLGACIVLAVWIVMRNIQVSKSTNNTNRHE